MVVFTCEQGTIILASQNSFKYSYRYFYSRIVFNGVKICRYFGCTTFYLSRFGNRPTVMDATDRKKTQQARMLQKLEFEQ
jgi:hypothetical protein